MAIELVSGPARAIVLPELGGRLHALAVEVGGALEELLWQPDDPAAYLERPTRGGSFPMAPWPNRVREGRFSYGGAEWTVPLDGKPHANHGRVFQRPWEVVARTARVVELRCAFDDGWPWQGSAWQRYELTDAGLRMKLEVRSAREPFPAGCGWHPWFRRDAAGASEVRVQVPAERRYILADGIPTGEVIEPAGEHDLRALQELGDRRIDDCFTGVTGPLVADWGRVRLTMSVDCAVPHVQVFTPDYAFCIEPQTCAPDAFNLAANGFGGDGMAIAAPGRPVAIESRWTWDVR
ncbi:MAG: hypothetical protein IT303_09365 [Dehalococcoidia bacterium]|nr:hypothetical protein [Dehalococcoidia bacterium]